MRVSLLKYTPPLSSIDYTTTTAHNSIALSPQE
jgi:hypothetical protein